MKFQADRAYALFAYAEPGIPMLQSKSRISVQLSSRFYRHILNKIERAGYDVFNTNTKLRPAEKLAIISAELWNRKKR